MIKGFWTNIIILKVSNFFGDQFLSFLINTCLREHMVSCAIGSDPWDKKFGVINLISPRTRNKFKALILLFITVFRIIPDTTNIIKCNGIMQTILQINYKLKYIPIHRLGEVQKLSYNLINIIKSPILDHYFGTEHKPFFMFVIIRYPIPLIVNTQNLSSVTLKA